MLLSFFNFEQVQGQKDASKTSKSGTQNLNRGKMETTTLVKSPVEGKEQKHPLNETEKVSDDRESAKETMVVEKNKQYFLKGTHTEGNKVISYDLTN